APVDPNATTPISDTSGTNRTIPISDTNATNATRAYGDGANRAYGEGATRAYGDAATPTRAPLGSPASPAGTRGSTASGADTDNADAVDDVRPSSPRGTDRPATDPRSSGPRGADTTGPDASATPPVAKPTSADAHVNRTTESDARGVDASTTAHTRSIPTRIADGPAEPADANETSEAPYTQPISASELRRRVADDDE
ncbi:hypothetical protein HWD93_18080, partial [Curtobacterium sp. C2H10]|nr:hypothetical protein [Curtobacterium sp. C2H10]